MAIRERIMSREKEVLRRVSFKAMSWAFTLVFGGVAIGLTASLTRDLSGGPLSGVAVSLGTIALVRRICGSRIILRASSLLVVNPLLTYTVSYDTIVDVRMDGGGTLGVVTRRGEEIYSVGFGGSLIDHFVGSSEHAVEKISLRVRRKSKAAGHNPMSKRFAIFWVADLCAVGAVALGVAALVIGP